MAKEFILADDGIIHYKCSHRKSREYFGFRLDSYLGYFHVERQKCLLGKNMTSHLTL